MLRAVDEEGEEEQQHPHSSRNRRPKQLEPAGSSHSAAIEKMANSDEPDEAARMLHNRQNANAIANALANGSSGPHTLAEQARAHSSSPGRIPLFERASARWWNPQFESATLETQYWKCSFPLLRDRFRSGLVYILLTCALWMFYLRVVGHDQGHQWVSGKGTGHFGPAVLVPDTLVPSLWSQVILVPGHFGPKMVCLYLFHKEIMSQTT